MTEYQKTVLKLLCMIYHSVMQVPGVARYEHDYKFVQKVENKLLKENKGNEVK